MAERVYDLMGRDVADCDYCLAFQMRDWDALEDGDLRCTCERCPTCGGDERAWPYSRPLTGAEQEAANPCGDGWHEEPWTCAGCDEPITRGQGHYQNDCITNLRTSLAAARKMTDRAVADAREAEVALATQRERVGAILAGPVHGLLQTIRGACTDEADHREIDKLADDADGEVHRARRIIEGDGA